MKKLLLVLLAATPALAQTPERQAILNDHGVRSGCYVTGYTTSVQTLCRGQSGYNVEVQQLFDSFTVDELYTNSFGVTRTLGDDARAGHGIGPWVRGHVLKEYERRGVKL